MSSKFFNYKKSTLHFTVLGNGTKNLLLFHGFGQDQNIFYSLSKILSDKFTLYIFDLYFHGKSTWGYGELPLEKEHWKDTLAEFLKEYRIDHFSVAGFSLGGKFALATLEAWPDKIKEIMLLAPDGIKTSFWYSLATYPLLFRMIFRDMIRHPERFKAVTKTLGKLGMVDSSLLKFSEFQMNSEEKRNRVYFSWVVFRHLRFDLVKIAGLINQYNIPLTMIVGQYDKVIKPQNMEHFLRKLKKYKFETPEAGHTRLIAESAIYFSRLK